MGTSFHTYIADDLASQEFDPDRYKIYIMLGCVDPSERVRQGIQRLKSGGRTLVWVYFSDVRNTGLTDFTITYDKNSKPMQSFAESHIENKGGDPVVYPKQPLSCPRFSSDDIANSYTIAHMYDNDEATDEVSVLMKHCGSYRSIMSLLPCLPAKLLLELALFSGVLINSRTGDSVMVGGNYACFYALSDGQKRLNFKVQPRRITDVSTGEEYSTTGQMYFDFHAKSGETKIFRIEV